MVHVWLILHRRQGQAPRRSGDSLVRRRRHGCRQDATPPLRVQRPGSVLEGHGPRALPASLRSSWTLTRISQRCRPMRCSTGTSHTRRTCRQASKQRGGQAAARQGEHEAAKLLPGQAPPASTQHAAGASNRACREAARSAQQGRKGAQGPRGQTAGAAPSQPGGRRKPRGTQQLAAATHLALQASAPAKSNSGSSSNTVLSMVQRDSEVMTMSKKMPGLVTQHGAAGRGAHACGVGRWWATIARRQRKETSSAAAGSPPSPAARSGAERLSGGAGAPHHTPPHPTTPQRRRSLR